MVPSESSGKTFPDGEAPAYSALWTAASLGRTEEVRQLLAGGADIEQREEVGGEISTPLYYAAFEGHEAVVRLLLGKGAKVSVKSIYGWTPLHAAVSGGHESVVRLLLAHGADPSAKTKKGYTPGDFAEEKLEYGIASMLRAEAARRALYDAMRVIAALAAAGAVVFVRAVGVRRAIRAVSGAAGAISAAATMGATVVVQMARPSVPNQQARSVSHDI